jgi:hypothetical protein
MYVYPILRMDMCMSILAPYFWPSSLSLVLAASSLRSYPQMSGNGSIDFVGSFGIVKLIK